MRAKLSRSSTIFIHTRWNHTLIESAPKFLKFVDCIYLTLFRVSLGWIQMLDCPSLVSTMEMNFTSCKSSPKWVPIKKSQPGGSRYMKPVETWRLPTVKCLSWSSNSGPASLRLECLPAGAKHNFHLFGGVLLSLQSEVQSIGSAEGELSESPSLVIEI